MLTDRTTDGELNILVSSAGRRVALVNIMRETLKRLGRAGLVIASDMSPASAAFHAADRGIRVPPVTSDAFDDAMIGLCRNERVRLVVPTIDSELEAWARLRPRLQDEGTIVAVSSPETVAIGADKELTNRWLVSVDLPTVVQRSPEEAISNPDLFPGPVVVKPIRGSASIGVEFLSSVREVVRFRGRKDLIVQEAARGVEHTIDALVSATGRMLCAVPRVRLEVRNGESSKGVTVRNPVLNSIARRICESLPGAYGAITIQAFVDEPTGSVKVIEINPRFGGGYPLSWQAGARYPEWMIQEILGMAHPQRLNGWQEGLAMLRYDEAVFVDSGTTSL